MGSAVQTGLRRTSRLKQGRGGGPFRRLRSVLRLFLSIVLLTRVEGGAPSPLAAQSLLPTPTHAVVWWTTQDGLPGNAIRNLALSRDGRLWMIAGGILTRFDGRTFETVPIQTESLESGRGEGPIRSIELPQALASGSGDTLWVQTSAGRMLFRARGEWKHAFDSPASVDEIATANGHPPISRLILPGGVGFMVGDRTVEAEPSAFTGLFPVAVEGLLAVGSDGTAWAIHQDGQSAHALPSASRSPLRIDRPRFVQSEDAPDPLVTRLRGDRLQVEDPEGEVWASIPADLNRTPLLLTRNGRLLAHAGEGLEIHHRDSGTLEKVDAGVSLALSEIGTVQEDREGGIWIGTGAYGLLNLRRSGLIQVTPSSTGRAAQIGSLAQGWDGSVVGLGSDLLRVGANRVLPLDLDPLPPHRQVTAYLEDRRGRRWAGVIPEPGEAGIWMEEPNGARRFFPAEGIPREILEDDAGNRILWMTDSEWCEYPNLEFGRPTPRCRDLSGFAPRDLLVDRGGAVWIAGGGGVQVHGSGGVRHYSPESGFALDGSRALHEDRDEGMWVGSYFRGITLLRGDTVYRATRSEGLAEDVVSTLLEDEQGYFWMGGNRGVHRVARTELLELFRGERSRVSAALFDERFGLLNPEGSGWHAQKDGAGRLWFPTFGGAVGVLPGSAWASTSLPGVVTIDAIEAVGRRWPVSDTLSLPKGVRSLRISVAAVSLQFPEAEVVKFRLEGQGEEWRPSTGNQTLEFTALRPGRWRLEVEAWGEEPSRAEMTLVVPPFFRETWTFRGLMLLGLAGLFRLLVKLRIRGLAARADSLEAEVEEQTHWLRIENERTAAALERAAEVTDQLHTLLTSKARVFASLSHELRTPLMLISGPLGEMAGGSSERDVSRLSVMRSAVQRLERLTGQFLDLADTQSGTLKLNRQLQNLGEFAQACVRDVLPLAERRKVRITVEPPKEPLLLHFDPDQLDKVLLNLLSNALKHSRAGGAVRVRVGVEPGDGGEVAVLEVIDEGPGIPEAMRARIFDPFFQGPDATEGMGLGLSLARDVVVMHGGRIGVESPAEGGATFRVTLPIRADPSHAEPPIHPATPSPSPPATPAPSEATPRIRLLLVEDDLELQDYLTREMAERFEVRATAHGQAALECLRSWTPNVILSDVVMPGMDGLGLCRILKADPATRAIPFILLTARSQREDQERGLLAGADDYIVKPFQLQALILKIENLVQLSRRIELRFSQGYPFWATKLLRNGVEQLDAPSEHFLEKFYQVVIERMGDPDLDMEQLSRALHMSRSTLFRRCRELLGASPLDVLSEIRLEQAALWLGHAERSVQSVAREVGFRNPSYFTRRFTAHFGVSPSAYRSRLNGSD